MRLTTAGSPPGDWSNRRRPTGPRSTPRATSHRRHRRPAHAATPRRPHPGTTARAPRSIRRAPANSRSANPNHVKRADAAVGSDGDAEQRRPRDVRVVGQTGDRPAQLAGRPERRLARNGRSPRPRRGHARRARSWRPCRHRRSATRARGVQRRMLYRQWSGGAGRELAVHLQRVAVGVMTPAEPGPVANVPTGLDLLEPTGVDARELAVAMASRSGFGVSGPRDLGRPPQRGVAGRPTELDRNTGVGQERQAVRDLGPDRPRDRRASVSATRRRPSGLHRQDRLHPRQRPLHRGQAGMQFEAVVMSGGVSRPRSPRRGRSNSGRCSMFSGVMRHMSAASPDTKFITRSAVPRSILTMTTSHASPSVPRVRSAAGPRTGRRSPARVSTPVGRPRRIDTR